MFWKIRLWFYKRGLIRSVEAGRPAIVPVDDPGGRGPSWAYTVGRWAISGQPELIVFGPDGHGAANFLSHVGAAIESEELSPEAGLRWSGLPSGEVCFRRVHESHYLDGGWFTLSSWLHYVRTGRIEPVLAFQVFLPDEGGRYPWEEGCVERMREMQPGLFGPRDSGLPDDGIYAYPLHPPGQDIDALFERDMERIDREIQDRGWSIVRVGSYSHGSCAYTVGFGETLGRPELIMFDLPRAVSAHLAGEIYTMLSTGSALEDGAPWPEDDPMEGVWRKVHPSNIYGAGDWLPLAVARRLRRTSSAEGLEAFQYVLCDSARRYPWEAGYDESLRHLQQSLWEPARARSPSRLPLPAACDT